MQRALHIKTTVLPGQRVEVTGSDLKEGEAVDVFVVLPPAAATARRSALQIIRSLHGHRLFETSAEVDQYLHEERDSWER